MTIDPEQLAEAIKEDFDLRQDCIGQVYWPYKVVLEAAKAHLAHLETANNTKPQD